MFGARVQQGFGPEQTTYVICTKRRNSSEHGRVPSADCRATILDSTSARKVQTGSQTAVLDALVHCNLLSKLVGYGEWLSRASARNTTELSLRAIPFVAEARADTRVD